MLEKNSISEIGYCQAVTLNNLQLIIFILLYKNNYNSNLLLNSLIINILDLTVCDIEESTLICEYPEIELNYMRSQICYLMP